MTLKRDNAIMYKKIWNYFNNNIWKISIYLIGSGSLFFVSIYSKQFTKLNILIQATLYMFFAILFMFSNFLIDEFKYGKLFANFKSKNKRLEKKLQIKTKDISELQKVIANFLNNSKIYKDKIVKKLDIDEEFLCIMKSSEGFSEIWKKLEPENKKMLPFTKVLSEIKGSVRPFERDGLFVIPIKNLENFNKNYIRKYIMEDIIPLVKKERKNFISTLPDHLKLEVSDFSYKYIAFVLRKNSLDYDTKNRTFNNEFIEFVVSQQATQTLIEISQDLFHFIKGKDIFLLSDWEAFVPSLNEDQKRLINENKKELNQQFKNKRIINLIDISNCNIEDIKNIFNNVLKDKTSDRKSKNLAEKIIRDTNKLVEILRKSGANI